MKLIVDGMIQVDSKIREAAALVIALLNSGKSADIHIVEHSDEKPRSNPQNKLIYFAYERIGKTLYGNDELLARRECKLMYGCRILYRESEKFRETFDKVIRPLPHETRLESMDLISVSSLMSVRQCKEYLTTILNQYTLKGVYFADLGGVEEYMNYKEFLDE